MVDKMKKKPMRIDGQRRFEARAATEISRLYSQISLQGQFLSAFGAKPSIFKKSKKEVKNGKT